MGTAKRQLPLWGISYKVQEVAKFISALIVVCSLAVWAFNTTNKIKDYVEEQDARQAKGSQQLTQISKQIAEQYVTQKLIIKKTGSCYWKADSSGKTIEVGIESLNLTGRPAEDLMGFGWINFVVQEDRAQLYDIIQKALVNHTDFYATFRMVKPDGSIIKVRSEAYRVVQNNKIVSYIGMLTLVNTN